MTRIKLLPIISGNTTTIQSSKLSSGDNLTVDAGNNLLLLTVGNIGTKDIVNATLTANNLTFNVSNQTTLEYNSKTQPTYLSQIQNQIDPEKLKLQSREFTEQNWSDTVRGLTTTGQVGIATAAVAVAIGTGGIGSGISGAMMTAAATTAGTTATISATNASMNTDSSVWGSAKSISSDAWRDTASDESLRNIAIAAAVAGATSWAVEASGGSATVEKGVDAVYKPNKDLIEAYPERFADYNGVIDPSANNIGIANTTKDISKVGQPVDYSQMTPIEKVVNEGGIISNNANKIGGMNGMSTVHDPLTNNIFFDKVPLATQLSIPPAIAIEYCAIFPAACGVATSGLMNNDFGTKK